MLKKPYSNAPAAHARQDGQILNLQFTGNQPGAEEPDQLILVPIEVYSRNRIVILSSEVLQTPGILLAGTFKLMHQDKISLLHRHDFVAVR